MIGLFMYSMLLFFMAFLFYEYTMNYISILIMYLGQNKLLHCSSDMSAFFLGDFYFLHYACQSTWLKVQYSYRLQFQKELHGFLDFYQS